jgi:DNA polymerase-3 subunit chi
VTEIGFYHLTRSPLPDALARLLRRTLDSGERAVVLGPDPARVSALDAALWDIAAVPWLPHGTARDGDADLQPIWLTDADEPAAANGARFLFLVEGAATAHADGYARLFDLFDGADPDAVAAARTRYAAARAAGHTLTYWQQGARGWERQA